MSNENRPRFLLNNCCFCCTVETGSRIIGYIGAIGAAINIVLGVVTLILLSIGQYTTTTTTVTVSGINTGDGNNNVNVGGNTTTAPVTGSALVAAFILTVFTILVYLVILFVNVVLLTGLRQKRPQYLKFYLVVGAVSLIISLILAIIGVITTFSFASIVSLIYLHLPLYFLLVIRTAYYNMLEADASKPNIIYAPAPTESVSPPETFAPPQPVSPPQTGYPPQTVSPPQTVLPPPAVTKDSLA